MACRPSNKLEIWEQLKLLGKLRDNYFFKYFILSMFKDNDCIYFSKYFKIGVTDLVSAVYASCILVLSLIVQMNLIAGKLFQNTTSNKHLVIYFMHIFIDMIYPSSHFYHQAYECSYFQS